jgi:hypothetical protein
MPVSSSSRHVEAFTPRVGGFGVSVMRNGG